LNAIVTSAVTPLENVAETVLVDVPAVVGVPVMVPVVKLNVKPAGRMFLTKDGLLPVGTTVKVIGVIAEPSAPFTLL
jgi:hypothetical protein